LGASTYSSYRWLKLFEEPASEPDADHELENRRLKHELERMT
jgi:hypothetical protein